MPISPKQLPATFAGLISDLRTGSNSCSNPYVDAVCQGLTINVLLAGSSYSVSYENSPPRTAPTINVLLLDRIIYLLGRSSPFVPNCNISIPKAFIIPTLQEAVAFEATFTKTNTDWSFRAYKF